MRIFLFQCEHIHYEGERFLYLHERILVHYFLENFSLGSIKASSQLAYRMEE